MMTPRTNVVPIADFLAKKRKDSKKAGDVLGDEVVRGDAGVKPEGLEDALALAFSLGARIKRNGSEAIVAQANHSAEIVQSLLGHMH